MESAYAQRPENEQEESRTTAKRSSRDRSDASSVKSAPAYDNMPAVRLSATTPTPSSESPLQPPSAAPTPAPKPTPTPAPAPKPAPPPAPAPSPSPAPPSPAPAPPAPAPVVTGILTAKDNFTGRKTDSFGIAEVVDLSFTSSPVRTAAQLGGLKWSKSSGNGTVTGGGDGLGTFTADSSPGPVTLVLSFVSGTSAGKAASTHNITVVAPDDALMVQHGTKVSHTVNTWSVGFQGDVFLRPKDVSFKNIQWREGTVAAVASDFLALWNGKIHAIGGWMPVGNGNSALGCKVATLDTVTSGQLNPPYDKGDFLWAIPWEYKVGGGSAVFFTTANHHATSDKTGHATIEKKGAGPFAKDPSDPTSSL